MIRYEKYRIELLNAKLFLGLSYREFANMTTMTYQNMQQILTGKSMGSHESYRELEALFQPSNTFIEYTEQFKRLFEQHELTIEEVANAIGMCRLGLENIIECRHIGQYENYMRLEEYLCKLLEI
jgi:transcriptional regulator with XRE-family HTH domain